MSTTKTFELLSKAIKDKTDPGFISVILDTCPELTNYSNVIGSTPLIIACENNYTEAVRILLDNNADVNVKASHDMTALMYACEHDNIEMVQLLLDNNANVNDRNYSNVTPLMIACGNGHKNIAQLLVNNDADLNATNDSNKTALMLACHNGHEDIVQLLTSKSEVLPGPFDEIITDLLSRDISTKQLVDILLCVSNYYCKV